MQSTRRSTLSAARLVQQRAGVVPDLEAVLPSRGALLKSATPPAPAPQSMIYGATTSGSERHSTCPPPSFDVGAHLSNPAGPSAVSNTGLQPGFIPVFSAEVGNVQSVSGRLCQQFISGTKSLTGPPVSNSVIGADLSTQTAPPLASRAVVNCGSNSSISSDIRRSSVCLTPPEYYTVPADLSNQVTDQQMSNFDISELSNSATSRAVSNTGQRHAFVGRLKLGEGNSPYGDSQLVQNHFYGFGTGTYPVSEPLDTPRDSHSIYRGRTTDHLDSVYTHPIDDTPQVLSPSGRLTEFSPSGRGSPQGHPSGWDSSRYPAPHKGGYSGGYVLGGILPSLVLTPMPLIPLGKALWATPMVDGSRPTIGMQVDTHQDGTLRGNILVRDHTEDITPLPPMYIMGGQVLRTAPPMVIHLGKL